MQTRHDEVSATILAGEYPLSHGQAALWFHYKLAPHSVAYNLAGAAAIPAGTDLKALQSAFRMVAERHPMLRTLFAEQHGEPFQHVYPSLPIDFRILDASKWDTAELDAHLAEEIYRTFDLERGPTWRVVVFQEAPVAGMDDQDKPWNEHLVLLVLHHIITDMWSIAILMSEVAAYYKQATTATSAALKPLRFSYVDYVRDEKKRLAGPQAEESLGYWQTVLAGELSPVNLKSDSPRPIEFSGYGSAYSIFLDKQLTSKLQDLAAEQHVPLYTVLFTAFQTLLYRYTGQNKIVLGFPKAGRNPSTARLVGYFVNQIVVAADFSEDPSFVGLLNRIDETLKASRQYDWYPFSLLVQHLQQHRELNRSPLIQAVFSWQQAPSLIPKQGSSQFILRQAGQAVDMGGLVMRPVNLPYRAAPFELVVLAAEVSDGLIITLEYAADIFDQPEIARMAGRYQTLLESIASGPELSASKLNILPDSERKILIEDWNSTDASYPSGLCLHQLFEQQVEETPAATAISSGKGQMTYRQLNRQANQLAHYLQEHGIVSNSLVAVYLKPSIQMVRGLLGILKAGGAYLPLDPNNPKERLAFMLADAHPDLLITDRELQVNLSDFLGDTLIIDAGEDELTAQPQTNPACAVTPDNPAYVIYTSGSTGQPKGAILAHRGVVNLLADLQHRQAILPGEACSWWTSPSFDVSVYEIFSPLLAGGILEVIPENIRLDAAGLFEWLQLHQIRSAFLPPFLVKDLSDWIQDQPSRSTLHRLLVGVEPIPDYLLSSIHALLTSLAIINGYGPTETTICSTLYLVENVLPRPGNTPIGKPVANTRIYLLDQHYQPVPIGLVGEVYIGGVGLAHGYLNRPDLTSQRFIQSPFQNGEFLYQTGDLARYLPDGNIVFVGRSDTQIKLHGVRIELGEVEANLVQYPGIKQAVVQLHEQTSGGKQLVATMTTVLTPPPSPDKIRDYLKQRLPASMIPSSFIFLDEFPLTTTGKVDRKALPVSGLPRVKSSNEPEFFQTDVEQILASIWQQVLDVERIGRDDNFFNLGGDSILSLQIIALADEAGLLLKPRHIFQAPTIAELATLVQPIKLVQKSQIQPGDEGLIPLTPIEHWFFQQNLPDPYQWNQSLMFIPARPLDPRYLGSAVSGLLRQHDGLQLRFEKSAAGWRQSLSHSKEQIPFDVINLASLSEFQQREVIDDYIAGQQSKLNLSKGPLIRVTYFILGENKPGRLLIVIHHLVVDAVSWRVLVDDLQRTYQQLESGQPIQLPAKTTSFHIWARRLAEYADSTDVIQEADFWMRMVESCKRTSTPHPFISKHTPSQRDKENNIHHISVSLSEEETSALLHESSETYNTEINDLLLTALVRAFQRSTKKEAFWIDFESHGREDIFPDIDLSRTVGWFTALYPICLELPTNTGLGQSIKSIKEQLHRIPNHGLGYGVLRYLNQDPKVSNGLKDLSPAPVSFNYLGQISDTRNRKILFSLAPESPINKRNPGIPLQHPIAINAAVYQGKLIIDWVYDSHMHPQHKIEQVSDFFIAELRNLIANCLSLQFVEYTPSDFPMANLNQAELDTITRIPFRLTAGNLRRNIQAIYPLSPMQQGMIFHTLYTPESGIYFEQSMFTVQGQLDFSALEHAWQLVIGKHNILRTSFVWEGLDRILQLVHKNVEAPITLHDWRDIPEIEQKNSFERLLTEERHRGFDLSVPPLFWLIVLRLDDEKYTVLFNHHHALLDGWSISLLFEEVFAFYNSLINNQGLALSPAKPYQDYIAWLQTRDLTSAESYWRQELENFVPLTLNPLVASHTPLEGASTPAEQVEHLSISTTADLLALARQNSITISTLVQGAWAILLSQHFDHNDIIYGVTVSGRSPELSGFLNMIGLFINTLPFRVQVDSKAQLIEWLQYVQTKTLQIQQFDYCPLAQIQNWSGLSRNSPLFDTLFVFENYPAFFRTHPLSKGLKISSVHSVEQTAYPLTVAVTLRKQLELRLLYDPALFEPDAIRYILNQLRGVLEGMLANPIQRVSALYEPIKHEPDGLAAIQSGKHQTSSSQTHPPLTDSHKQIPFSKDKSSDAQKRDLRTNTALQEYLIHQWEKILNIEAVDLKDNFFKLGGDSLKGAICTYKIQNVIHETVPINAIFDSPTIK